MLPSTWFQFLEVQFSFPIFSFYTLTCYSLFWRDGYTVRIAFEVPEGWGNFVPEIRDCSTDVYTYLKNRRQISISLKGLRLLISRNLMSHNKTRSLLLLFLFLFFAKLTIDESTCLPVNVSFTISYFFLLNYIYFLHLSNSL